MRPHPVSRIRPRSLTIGDRTVWLRRSYAASFQAEEGSATHERGANEYPFAPVASTPHRLRAALSPRSTPGSFRLTAAVVTAICAVCAVVAAAAIVARSGSLNAAGNETQQLVDLQEIRTAAVEADAIAASSFLGGSESANQQVAYEARLAAATRLLRTSPSGQRPPTFPRSPSPTTPSCATPASSSRPGRTTAKGSRSAPPTSVRPRTCWQRLPSGDR